MTRRTGRHVTAAVAALCALALAACGGGSASAGNGGAGSAKSVIDIGQIASLTGGGSSRGKNGRLGAALAVRQINSAGGVLGKRLTITVKDDQTNPHRAVADFNELARAGARAVVGPSYPSASLAVIPLATKQRVPYVSTGAVGQQLRPASPYTYMTPPTAAAVAGELDRYFHATGMTTMAVAYDTQNAFATDGWKAMKARAATYGVHFAAVETFTTSQTDFRPLLRRARGSGASGLMVWAPDAPAVTIAQRFADAGMGGMKLVFSNAEASSLFTKPAGPAGNGVVVASSLAVIGADLPKSKLRTALLTMAEPFQEYNRHYPPPSAFDGYSAVQLIAAAIAKAGSASRPAIAHALNTLTTLTPEGTYRFTPSDHAGLGASQVAIDVITGGQITPTSWTRQQLAPTLSH